jgi:sigma-B regulation protein RsbU (phosphoserine phosphatase)
MLSSPLQILMLEDDDSYATLVARMLRNSGSELVVAPKLEIALRHLMGRQFDVVLSDLNVPDSRGFETFQKMLAAAPKLPVVVLTGQDDDALGLRTVQAGAQDYLIKDQLAAPLLFRALTYAIERKRMQLETARVTEELRRQNEEMHADLRMAREVQLALVPQGSGRSNGRVSFAHRFLPAQPVGGDFFAEFSPPEGPSAVLLCDVMGHGVRAALVASLLRALVDESALVALSRERELNDPVAGPEHFLAQLNRSLRGILRQVDQQIFVTALCAVADAEAGRVRFASAGHPNPLLIDTAKGEVSSLESTRGPPLGITDSGEWVGHNVPFGLGQRLLLFTDGLYEVEGPEGEQFGLARLSESVERKLTLPAPQLLTELVEEGQEFSTTGDFNDDVCAILMERER